MKRKLFHAPENRSPIAQGLSESKRAIWALCCVICFMAIFLVGCSGGNDNRQSYIRPVVLTPEQEDVLRWVDISRSELLFFDFAAHEGGGASAIFDSLPMDNHGLPRAFGSINAPVYMENGQEIILYMSKFAHGSLRTFGDLQVFLTQPEYLAEYTYAYVIKARFS